MGPLTAQLGPRSWQKAPSETVNMKPFISSSSLQCFWNRRVILQSQIFRKGHHVLKHIPNHKLYVLRDYVTEGPFAETNETESRPDSVEPNLYSGFT